MRSRNFDGSARRQIERAATKAKRKSITSHTLSSMHDRDCYFQGETLRAHLHGLQGYYVIKALSELLVLVGLWVSGSHDLGEISCGLHAI